MSWKRFLSYGHFLRGISGSSVSPPFHDDVIKWKHFPLYWPFVRGIHRSRWIPRTKAGDAELWCFFYLRPNKRLRKQPWCWRFETLSWSLWRHCNTSKVQWCPALMFSLQLPRTICQHYNDAIVDVMAAQITSLTIIYSTVYSGTDQRKHQSSASLVFERVNSPQKWPVTRKMFPFDDVNMK